MTATVLGPKEKKWGATHSKKKKKKTKKIHKVKIANPFY